MVWLTYPPRFGEGQPLNERTRTRKGWQILIHPGYWQKQEAAKRVRQRLEKSLLPFIPGYAFIKGFADNLRQTEEKSTSFVPVMVQFDDHIQNGV